MSGGLVLFGAVLLLGAGALLVVSHLVWRVWELFAAWRRRIVLAAGLAPVAVVGLVFMVGPGFIPGEVSPVLVVAAAVCAVVWWMRRGRSSAIVARWANRARRTSGVATSVDILRVSSAVKMRRRARTVRPSLADLPRAELRRLPVTAYAVRLLQVARQWVWASVEDVVIVFGGPRTGKTGWLAGVIVDAPGAAVVASTRRDLMRHTEAVRAQRGRVLVFNPGGLGGTDPRGELLLPSTVGFDPLVECDDPIAAFERAMDMLPDGGTDGDRSHWIQQGRRVLASHLHAAAIGHRTMQDVYRWIADPDAEKKDVRALLGMSRKSSQAFVADLDQFATTNDKTRSSITTGITLALQWLMSPHAVAATQVQDGRERFDGRAFIEGRATLYLLGRDESYTSSLMAALVGYIVREARRLASEKPGERLDPPLTLALDEAGRSAPVPLDDVTGDAGGSGITVLAVFQSLADVRARWSENGAAKILNNAAARMVFGGTADPHDLAVWTALAGTRDERVKTRDAHGATTSETTRPVDVLTAARLSNLPEGVAAVFRRGMPLVIGRPQMIWHRADVREAAQRARYDDTLAGAWAATQDRTALVRAGESVVDEAERVTQESGAGRA